MRLRASLVGLAILASTADAAPRPAGPPPVKDRKELRAEAQRYAQQISLLVEQIHRQYVRPVTREDLLEAALLGLFQAARRPVPRDLRATVRQTVSITSMLLSQADGALNGLGASDRRNGDPIEKLLVRMREQVGEAEGLVGQNAILVSCKSIARLLDPHSGLVTLEDQKRAIGQDHENLGSGLEFKDALTPGPLEVEGVHLGSPAQRAGLRPGDVLVALDGQPAARANPSKLLALRNSRVLHDVAHLAAPTPPTPDAPPSELPTLVKVTYRRQEETVDRTVTLLRERYRCETVLGVRRRDDNSWDWFVDEKTGLAHIRLSTLSRGTSEDLRETLANLRVRKVRGILFDLRWCPGGYLNEAVDTAELFLGTGVIATIKSRGREDTVHRSTDEGKFRDVPLVVLVNGETSGGAELIAAALQDHKRATIVGQRTLGKGSVQTPIGLGIEGVGFKLTSGTFVRPGGKNLHRFPDSKSEDDWGVLPDEDARLSAELGKRLKSWWALQSLRPARSRERLPLDDPRADPQQQLALDILRDRVARKP